MTVVNRSPERAEALAQAVRGQARPLEALATELAAADVVISSTAKEGFVISYDLMQGVAKMRKWRPLFIIDIAVPRDVDPRVEGLRNVFLYDMDDLKRVSQENLKARERAASAAETIVDEEVADYERWLRTLELTPTIVALRERVRGVVLAREAEDARPSSSGMSAAHERALDAMCESIVNQLLHAPLTELKRSQQGRRRRALVHAVQRLFKLDVEQSCRASERQRRRGAVSRRRRKPANAHEDPHRHAQERARAGADALGRRAPARARAEPRGRAVRVRHARRSHARRAARRRSAARACS